MTNTSKVVIDASSTGLGMFFRKAWRYRSVLLTLAKRDLKIKYANSVLGVAWTMLQPLTGLLIFTFFFNLVINIEVPGGDYALFAFSGMTAWYFFSYIMYQSGSSFIQGQELMKKIYFPKILLPLSKVLVGFVELALSLFVLFVLMAVKQIWPTWHIVYLPLFVIANMIVGLSISLWLATLTIQYRDLHHILPYLVNFGIWLTPVFYPSTLIPDKYSHFLYFNPMAGVIEGYRFALLPDYPFDLHYLWGIGISAVLFILGILFLRKVEDGITDTI